MRNKKILKIGDEGDEVLDLQIRLSNVGFKVDSIETTSKKFGSDTENKLKTFKNFVGLKVMEYSTT